VLEPALKFAANFDADAFLSVSARLLPFMDEKKYPDSAPLKDPSSRTVDLYTSERFNLFRYQFVREAKGKLSLAKGSPLRCWTDDPDRLAEAGVPDDIEFLTKPALATGMLTRALHAGVPARWATGDEVYGNDPGLRAECETQQIGYVLAIGCDRRVPTPASPSRADTLVAGLPRQAWQQLSAGPGAKGERRYDWAWITLTPDSGAVGYADGTESGCWWLLVRRNRTTGELAFYRCYSPQIVPMRELVRVAGRRWTIEETFQTGKGLAGLDEHQVRRWTSWRRWTLLSIIAHALLVTITANEHTDRPTPTEMIPLTCSEIRRLLGKRRACRGGCLTPSSRSAGPAGYSASSSRATTNSAGAHPRSARSLNCG
jgi:hypothetical protein